MECIGNDGKFGGMWLTEECDSGSILVGLLRCCFKEGLLLFCLEKKVTVTMSYGS